jgi:hypothetical protein
MKKIFTQVVTASVLAGCAMLAHAGTELVVNGDFETGDVNGWVESGNLAGGFVFPVVSDPVNSSNILGIFSLDSPYFVSQTLNTNSGASYRLSFDLQVQGLVSTPGAITFEAWFGNQQVFGVVDQTMEWTHFSFNNLSSNSSLTELKLGGRNDPDFTRLDNVSVQAVPEPETLAMLLAGLGLLAWRARSRQGV